MPKRYPVTQTPDGYIIPGVPIFPLGTHRNFQYDQPWADRAIANFAADKTKGFLPPVIVGHNEDGKIEKAAVALFDNLRVEDHVMVADYLIETDGALKLFQSAAFPNRSIEVYDQAARITAVAMLGGTEPYHKLPALKLEKFKALEADAESETLEFSNADITIDGLIEGEKARQELCDLDYVLWDAMWSVKQDEVMTPEQKKAKISELVMEWAGLKITAEQAMIPPDNATLMAALPDSLKEKFTAQQAELEKFRADKLTLEKEKTDRIKSDFKQRGLAAPLHERYGALRDTLATGSAAPVKFKNQETLPAEFLDQFLHDVLLAAKDGKLLAPLTETAPIETTTATIYSTTDDQGQVINADVDAAVKQHMKAHNIPAEKYLDTLIDLRKSGVIKKA